MGKKLNKVYDGLVNGAVDGLVGEELYAYVTKKSPKTSSKRIVKASLFALSDPDLKDRAVLEAIYALAIRYRLSYLGVEEDAHEVDDDDGSAPSISQELKNRLESTVSTVPSTTEDAAMAEIAKSVH